MRKKVHRFFVTEALSLGRSTVADKKLAHQLEKVLKIELGEQITLFNTEGVEATGTLSEITNTHFSIQITELHENKEIGTKVTLYAAILKSDHFELAVQKAVEVGVHSVVPLITDRTIKTGLKRERLETIMKEAAEQSGRSYVPTLHEAVSFNDAVKQAQNSSVLFFDPSGSPISSLLSQTKLERSVFIGPEGGWSEQELLKATELGFMITSLGDLILRGETAVTVATYIAVHQ